MTTKNKKIIGALGVIGLGALAYLLLFKKKPATVLENIDSNAVLDTESLARKYADETIAEAKRLKTNPPSGISPSYLAGWKAYLDKLINFNYGRLYRFFKDGLESYSSMPKRSLELGSSAIQKAIFYGDGAESQMTKDELVFIENQKSNTSLFNDSKILGFSKLFLDNIENLQKGQDDSVLMNI